MYGSFLSLAHRETVLVETWRTRATSAVRRYSPLRFAVLVSAIASPLLKRESPGWSPWTRSPQYSALMWPGRMDRWDQNKWSLFSSHMSPFRAHRARGWPRLGILCH